MANNQKRKRRGSYNNSDARRARRWRDALGDKVARELVAEAHEAARLGLHKLPGACTFSDSER